MVRYLVESWNDSALVDTTGASFHAELDPMATWTREVVNLDGTTSVQEEPLYSTVEQAGIDASFTPLFALTQQAKYFDDRLMVRVEQLAHESTLAGPGLIVALEALRNEVPRGSNARGLLNAARHLLGEEVPQFGPDAVRMKHYLRDFELDEKRSKPLGVWTESQPLRDLFRHDRLLQERFKNGVAGVFREAMHRVPQAHRAYLQYLALGRLLSGPPAASPVTAPWSGAEGQIFALLPAAESTESRLLRELFTDRPVPEGFKLVDELIERIRDGRIQTTPSEESSWYEHQQHAAAALLAAETESLSIGEHYRDLLEDAFRALFTLNRETHVKQLDLAVAGGGCPFYVVPEFSLEPLPDHYARLATSYRRLRLGLREVLGERLTETTRWETRGAFGAPSNTPLEEAILAQELLFRGAELTSRDELGQAIPKDAASTAARIHFKSWQALSPRAPALSEDLRVAAPVYFDRDRNTTRICVLLGLRQRRLEFHFTQPPRIEPITPDASPSLSSSSEIVLTPVTLECDVARIPDRKELRALCDRERTPARIRTALEEA